MSDMKSSRRAWTKIAVFYALALLFSGPFYALILSAGKLRSAELLYVTGLTWCPALAAFATRALFREDTRDFGWKWGAARYSVWAYLIPVAYALPVYLFVWLTGLGDFDLTSFAAGKASDFGWSADSPVLVLIGYTLLAGSAGMIVFGARTLGEEIGWRGFLVPELSKVVGFRGVALISGLMWAAWHFPILIFGDYNAGAPAWFSLVCFTAMVLGISVIMVWLRLSSGSLWPAVIAHASHNRFIQTIFTPLTKDTGHTNYIIDEFGIGLALTTLVAAALLWRFTAKPTVRAAG